MTGLASLPLGPVLAPLAACIEPLNVLVAQIFIKPIPLSTSARLWMFLPLAVCIALVYRATRSRTVRDIPRGTVFTFLNIVIGMSLIAAGLYALDRLRIWLLY